MEVIRPDWGIRGVAGVVTTRAMGDMGGNGLRALLPGPPTWMKQVHGRAVIDADRASGLAEADAAVTRTRGTVCAVKAADCMPVLLAADDASVAGIAHAGWRGLAGGVIEAALDEMRVEPSKLVAWLGPAIGPRVYEVGADVHAAFPRHALSATRPSRWLLDLYAVARERLRTRGVTRIHGGGFCTYTESERFFSYRRERTAQRMVAAIWLT